MQVSISSTTQTINGISLKIENSFINIKQTINDNGNNNNDNKRNSCKRPVF